MSKNNYLKCKVRSFAFEIRPCSWVITDNLFKCSTLALSLSSENED